jgi:hypothetical protein
MMAHQCELLGEEETTASAASLSEGDPGQLSSTIDVAGKGED